jgi:hypothetical protein
MSFKDKPFSERFEKLGDEAEGIFEQVYPNNFVRFGLDRPNINLARVPPFVRYTPDYLTAKGLVEVQGFGRDQMFKVKHDKLDALSEWSEQCRVDFFLWDSWNRSYAWLRLGDLADAYDRGEDRCFPEGKSYRAWPAPELPVGEWFSYDDGLASTTQQ